MAAIEAAGAMDKAAAIRGMVSKPAITKVSGTSTRFPLFSGTCTTGLTVRLLVDSKKTAKALKCKANGTWSQNVPGNVEPGDHTFSVRAENGKDADGKDVVIPFSESAGVAVKLLDYNPYPGVTGVATPYPNYNLRLKETTDTVPMDHPDEDARGEKIWVIVDENSAWSPTANDPNTGGVKVQFDSGTLRDEKSNVVGFYIGNKQFVKNPAKFTEAYLFPDDP